MVDQFILILLVAVISIVVLAIVKLASFLQRFYENTQYICWKMDWADSDEEYRRWRKELRCHYLTLIPFVTARNVIPVYDFFFQNSNHAEKEERKDCLVPLLMPSILGICICMICVCSMTWAWYSAGVSGGTTTLKAARYEIAVEIKDTSGELITANVDGSYTLHAGTYTVALTAHGDASTGYCKMDVGGRKLHSSQLYTKQSDSHINTLTFTVTAESAETVSFISVWGTYSGQTVEIEDGANILLSHTPLESDPSSDTNEKSESQDVNSVSSNSAETSSGASSAKETYVVQNGDTLSVIADRFHTTVEKLAAYNNISTLSGITSGQILKIPPQDYKIPPVATAPETSRAETQPPASEASAPEETIVSKDPSSVVTDDTMSNATSLATDHEPAEMELKKTDQNEDMPRIRTDDIVA